MKSHDPQHRWAELRLLRDHVAEHVRRTNVILNIERRTIAPQAQIIEFLHRILGQSAIVYYPTAGQAHSAVALLRNVGLSASQGTPAAEEFNSDKIDILVCEAGRPPQGVYRNIHFILHASPPTFLQRYLLDLSVVLLCSPVCESVIFNDARDTRLRRDMGFYCRKWICRHAQIVRSKVPKLAIPEPREFSCHACDVCISQPRACYGDVDDTVHVPLRSH